jgi:hypothetical protein
MDSADVTRQSSDFSTFASGVSGSPATSVFSKGHMSRSSASSLSIASSPTTRESLDFFGPRLGKVAEEQERDGPAQNQVLSHSPTSCMSPSMLQLEPTNSAAANDYDLYFGTEFQHSPTSHCFPQAQIIGKRTDFSAVSLDQFQGKRQRSGDYGTSSLHHRLSSRFGSMSRRFKNRSEGGLPLSIVTQISAPPSRAGSTSSAQIVSPAVSAISKHESYLPPSPARETIVESVHADFAESDYDQEMEEVTEDQHQATTPLLPPAFAEHLYEHTPLQSPLQSPSIAPTPAVLSHHTSPSVGPYPMGGLPSPPLSAKQSLASIQQRSRANTAAAPIAEIPPLHLNNQDPWSQQLGHANFSIHPEPYLPEVVTVDTYTEFRSNWDLARKNYAKHQARTSEHHGLKSRVYKLTLDKWAEIDEIWKTYHDELENSVSTQIAELKRISDQSQQSQQNFALEKPKSRIAIPEVDYRSGKFPELGDGEIASIMEVAPPRQESMPQTRSPSSPRKRSFFRFLQDILGKA